MSGEEEKQDHDPLIDEQAQEAPAEEEYQTSWLERWCGFLYTYTTPKEVNIKDRRLGYMYTFFLVAIGLYLLIIVFAINKGYLDYEQDQGKAYVQILGNAVTTENFTYVWDTAEEVMGGKETNTAFIPTKVVITRRQFQGLCASPLLTCQRDSQCSTSDLPNVIETPTCGETPDGRRGCVTWQWCPPETPQSSQVYYLQGTGEQEIWIRTDVKFRYLSDKHKQTFDKEDPIVYPDQDANAFRVRDLLYLTGTNYTDIVEKGAVISVRMYSQCTKNPQEKCDTHLEVDRMDSLTGFGYSTSYARYYRENGVLMRDLYHMYGLRILVNVFGVFQTPSLQQIVLQVSAAIGQLIAAKKITDVVMTMLMKEKRHYNDLKIVQSKDFND